MNRKIWGFNAMSMLISRVLLTEFHSPVHFISFALFKQTVYNHFNRGAEVWLVNDKLLQFQAAINPVGTCSN